jgi:hypothetical protein
MYSDMYSSLKSYSMQYCSLLAQISVEVVHFKMSEMRGHIAPSNRLLTSSIAYLTVLRRASEMLTKPNKTRLGPIDALIVLNKIFRGWWHCVHL